MKSQTILVTGASGKTGHAIVSSLSQAGYFVTALTYKPVYTESLQRAGARSVIIGDLRSKEDLRRAIHGNEGVYHICPNMAPDEYDIGKILIEACRETGIDRFVYHSVLHPQIKSMPHHWQKMLVEEELFKSGLPYTILQPTAYMENILGYRASIDQGNYAVPYRSQTRISLVNLSDIGEVSVKIFSSPETLFGTFELAGTMPLSQIEVAEALSLASGTSIRAVEVDRNTWYQNALQQGMSEYTRNTLLAMFEYYDQYGLTASPETLKFLLGRQPTSLDEFLRNELDDF